MLESLEREYRREEDWCSSETVASSSDKAVAMQQLILKHQEKKEAFLKVRGHTHTCNVGQGSDISTGTTLPKRSNYICDVIIKYVDLQNCNV